MSDIQILMFCTAVIAVSACVINYSTKTIAAMLYCRMVTGDTEPKKAKPKSPYGLIRAQSRNNQWGYCVTKNSKIIRSGNDSSAPVYSSIKSVLKEINLYETIEGYELTIVEVVDE